MSPLFWIILLIVLGILLFIAELVLLPGITVAAVLAFGAFTSAVAWAFASYGLMWGFIALGAVLLLLTLITVIFLKPNTWNRVSLKDELPLTIDKPICELCEVGAHGRTITRIAPMGKVMVDGKVFEAKVIRGIIDADTDIKVVGFENQNVIIELS